jgi:hypothetical protein
MQNKPDVNKSTEEDQQAIQTEQSIRIELEDGPIIEENSSSEGREGIAVPEYSDIEMTRQQLYEEIWKYRLLG